MEEQERIVRVMARGLARGGLVHAYGHCSVRIDEKSFLVCASKPMGMIAPGEKGSLVSVEGPLPEGVLGEVRMHQQIYKRRPDVNAICRFLSPNVMALAAMGLTPKARHGFGSYFHPQVPFWTDPGLIRNEAAAIGVAETMGQAPAVVVNVNGAVTGGRDCKQALTLAWFLEDSARVEMQVMACGMEGKAPLLTEDQARARATWEGRIAERMWDHLTREDPELD